MNEPSPWERLTPPPRDLPPVLAARLRLGSGASQTGWLVLAFGSIFFWAVAWHGDLSGWRFRPDTAGRTIGLVLDCRDTHYSVGRSRGGSRGTPVYENRYRYAVNDAPLEGRSYATGVCSAGSSVPVEYLLSQPGFSRIAGMRRDLLGPWAALAAIIPAAGLAMILAGLVKGRSHARLLRAGMAAAGRLVKKTATGARTNGRMVYRMTFEFKAKNGAPGSTTLRANRPERLEDDSRELVLYDPEDLRKAVLVDSLPGNLNVDDRGELTASRSIGFLILPAIAILGNAWWYITHLWRRAA